MFLTSPRSTLCILHCTALVYPPDHSGSASATLPLFSFHRLLISTIYAPPVATPTASHHHGAFDRLHSTPFAQYLQASRGGACRYLLPVTMSWRRMPLTQPINHGDRHSVTPGHWQCRAEINGHISLTYCTSLY